MEDRDQKDPLYDRNKIIASGYLAGNTLHAVLNYLTGIRGYADMLLNEQIQGKDNKKAFEAIERLERKCSDALIALSDFYRKSREEYALLSINETIEHTLKLTWPMVKYSNITMEKLLGEGIPHIMASREQLVEAFAFIIINSFGAMRNEGLLKIETKYLEEVNTIEIIISHTAGTAENKHILDVSSAYEIIKRHEGSIDIKGIQPKGTVYIISIKSNLIS